MSIHIQAEGLSKWFGQVVALNDINLDLQAPILGLLGPNGAGKSTLLKLLVGQLKPSKGRLRLMGHRPWSNPALMAQIGFCPEHDRFYENMRAVEFVESLCRLHGFSKAEARRRSDQALDQVGLEQRGAQPIHSLSHGMRQRLKVAQALAHQPRLLLLDEPLNGLDPAQRARIIALVRQLAEQGVGVLISSHVLHELEAMTRHILLLHHGRVLATGQVSAIRDLIDAHPHRIAMDSADSRGLARELLTHEHVLRVNLSGARLEVETKNPDACFLAIGDLAADGRFGIQSLEGLDDNLEAVFRYLVK
ncbi:MAG: ABC transporter ATP-binding protein [Deltaproteobacteria bacterium]|nr:ABC transporter ATP-binding protein [Deltaproteobacteria bacterium]